MTKKRSPESVINCRVLFLTPPCVQLTFAGSHGILPSSLHSTPLVQAFNREKSANLPLIAKEGFLTVFGPGTCPLYHIKSPKKSEEGKLTKNEFFIKSPI